MIHALKILPQYFEAVANGTKNFEIRRNDRNYQTGDKLLLKEYEKGHFTGRETERWVEYIYHGDGTYGLSHDYCVMGLRRTQKKGE